MGPTRSRPPASACGLVAGSHAPRLCNTRRNGLIHHHHHPEGVVYRGFRLNSGKVAVSKGTARRWWCIESLFPVMQPPPHLSGVRPTPRRGASWGKRRALLRGARQRDHRAAGAEYCFMTAAVVEYLSAIGQRSAMGANRDTLTYSNIFYSKSLYFDCKLLCMFI